MGFNSRKDVGEVQLREWLEQVLTRNTTMSNTVPCWMMRYITLGLKATVHTTESYVTYIGSWPDSFVVPLVVVLFVILKFSDIIVRFSDVMEVTLHAVIFPACVVLLMALSLICSYSISVAKGDVAAFWPYISDGAVHYPETNVFAQLLDMSAFAAFCTFWLRYMRMRVVLPIDGGHVHSRRISVAAFIIGLLSLFGMILVGNFQDKPDQMHFLGAGLLFLLGTTYTILDTWLSFVTCHLDGSRRLCFSRVAIATTSTLFIILAMVGKLLSEKIWTDYYPNQDTKTRQQMQRNWTSTEPGYSLHILGSTSEWVVGVMFILYFLSFVADFRKLRFQLRVFGFTSPPVVNEETTHLNVRIDSVIV